MKKKYLFPLAMLIYAGIKFQQSHHTPSYETMTSATRPSEKSIIPKAEAINKPVMIAPARVPAQVFPEIENNSTYKGDLKFSHKKVFEELNLEELGIDESVKDLPRGMVFASAVKATTKDNYSPELGAIVQQVGEMIYFKSSENIQDDSINHVVLDKRTDKLYPLSSVVKVLSISESQRHELVSKGFEEYYYHDSLKLFYLQTQSSKTLGLVSEIKKLGFEVELEAIKDAVKKR